MKNLLKNQLARKAVPCVEASSGIVDSSLFKSCSPRVGWGHNRRSTFYIGIYYRKHIHLKNQLPRQAVTSSVKPL